MTTAKTAPRATRINPGAFRSCYRPYIDRAKLAGTAAVAQMAEDLRIFTANADSITREDLEILGWRNAQIDQFASTAREYAARASDR